MANEWNADLYRARAQEWRKRAEALPPGKERDGCLVVAQGYARLAEHIAQMSGTPASAE